MCLYVLGCDLADTHMLIHMACACVYKCPDPCNTHRNCAYSYSSTWTAGDRCSKGMQQSTLRKTCFISVDCSVNMAVLFISSVSPDTCNTVWYNMEAYGSTHCLNRPSQFYHQLTSLTIDSHRVPLPAVKNT